MTFRPAHCLMSILFAVLAIVPVARANAIRSVMFHRQPAAAATDRIIVKWRSTGVAASAISAAADRAVQLSGASGISVLSARELYDHTDLVRLTQRLDGDALHRALARLKADPSVEYAEADAARFLASFPADLPDDPHFKADKDSIGSWQGQWYLLPPSSAAPAAISATTAWLTTTGSSSVVVAVIDSGVIKTHPDLAGKLLPGYDFVSCDQGNSTSTTYECSASGSSATFDFANDGNGWDSDPADPGDWIDANDAALTLFKDQGCTKQASSSWHGTKVAGIIGAITNNGLGIAGVAPDSLLLPVRVIGKCLARVSDIAAAIRWAAGLTVTGVSTNPNPAKIINISLAANTTCSSTEQDAITAAIDAGALVVAAAGNDGGPVNAPANCSGVLSVSGIRQIGTKVAFSSLSSADAAVTVAAPGGNCVNTSAGSVTVGIDEPCLYGIETTTDAGTTTPSTTSGFYAYGQLNQSYIDAGGNVDNAANVGTSFAAPMTAGVAALMLATNPALTPAQLIARLKASAAAFPTSSSTTTTLCSLASDTTDSNGDYTDTSQQNECICTTATCGAGMLNASTALQQATAIFASISLSSSTGTPGQHITLDGSASSGAAGHSITQYQWSTIPATSNQLINATSSVATLVVPSFRSIQVQLTITDDAGNVASTTATVESPLAASSGSGGGGLDPFLLVGLAVVLGYQRRRKRPN